MRDERIANDAGHPTLVRPGAIGYSARVTNTLSDSNPRADSTPGPAPAADPAGEAATSVTRRPSVPALDAMIGVSLPCLDHGFVRLVDYMGDDHAIVQAARVSYGKGTRRAREDRGLIRYLLRHHHTTPFEMCEIKVHMKLPIFVARQLARHRTASLNEVSGRYSILDNEFYVPDPSVLGVQSTNNRQGRGEPVTPERATHILDLLKRDAATMYAHYEEMLGGRRRNAEDGRAARRGDRRHRARAGAHQPVRRLLHAVVLEDRSPQSAAFHRAACRSPCAVRDPRLRRGARLARPALGSRRVRGVRRLPDGSRVAVAHGDRRAAALLKGETPDLAALGSPCASRPSSSGCSNWPRRALSPPAGVPLPWLGAATASRPARPRPRAEREPPRAARAREAKRLLVVKPHDQLGDFPVATPAARRAARAPSRRRRSRSSRARISRRSPAASRGRRRRRAAAGGWRRARGRPVGALGRAPDAAFVLNSVSRSRTADLVAATSGAR
jgi:flavin-dependent thymidylate synthase